MKKLWVRILGLRYFTPEVLALSLAFGLVLGVFPVYGIPTLLCAGAAVVLRLNFPALQLVNMLSSPLQFALFMPFHRLGVRLLPADHLGAVLDLEVRAIAGWLCLCLPLGLLLYLGSLATLRCMARRRGSLPADPGSHIPPGCESF